MIKFCVWLEQKEIEDAILGVIGGEEELSPQEKDHLLKRNTKDFGAEIKDKLKNLGVIKGFSDQKGKYGELVNLIDDGINISDLINMIES